MAPNATQAERLKALQDLRQKRMKVSPAPSNVSNGSSTAAGDRVTSRHFPVPQGSSSSHAKVLVPNSSPSASPVSSTKLVYKPHAGHGVPLTKPSAKAIMGSDDSLMVSSNFKSSLQSFSYDKNSSSSAKPRNGSTKATPGDDDRPRKRLNTGSSTPGDPIVISSSPSRSITSTPPVLTRTSSSISSAQISDARRVLSNVHLGTAPSTSDDELPDLDRLGQPSRRLIRGQRTVVEVSDIINLTSSPDATVASQSAIRRVKEVVMAPDARIKQVLMEEKNDIDRTVERLLDEKDVQARKTPGPSASSPPAVKTSFKSGGPLMPSATGQVIIKKVRGPNVKSAIYANRGAIGQSGPSTPLRTGTAAPTVKRKRRGGESDDDSAFGSDNGKGKGKKAVLRDDDDSEDGFDEDTELKASRAEGVEWFNKATVEDIIALTSCTQAQAQSIISLRPFESHDHLKTAFRKKKGISYKLFEIYINVMEGFGSLDTLLKKCEDLGQKIDTILAKWAKANASAAPSKAPSAQPSRSASVAPDGTPPLDDAGIHLTQVRLDSMDSDDPDLQSYIREQPALIADGVTLKDYQMIGVNWLYLLWSRGTSCILADEMGLGKTIQVIALFAYIKQLEPESNARHLVIVPPSTLENWMREFTNFAPELHVQSYYGSQPERMELRHSLLNSDWDVLVTTYNFAQGNEYDKKFFKKVAWQICVFDEGHMLKNFQSQRYENLMKIRAPWRLLLTGTPLQNNLQELVSLLNFIMPKMFADHVESLRAIFKAKADTQLSFLAKDRVERAKKMMTPFVLRRRKDQVLKDLPKKTERIEWCEMTPMQKSIYKEALQRSRKTLQTQPDESQVEKPEPKAKPKGRLKSKIGAMNGDTSSNVLMDLRKAASHPMLFRRHFNDDKIKIMARHCMKEPEFCESNYDYIVEDMEVMTDAELQTFCKKYKTVSKHALPDDTYLGAGKITKLMGLLEHYKEQGKRILVFSQFTQVLDIIQKIFHNLDIKYLVLTGSTAVDERQSLVDEFTEDESIPVFLLSTKAGGMGINLTAACVVIIFDQDFNPHNDKQACDRAYRIGQKRDVEIVKLITKGTIEEDMYKIGNTKLMLDDAVAGNAEEEDDSKAAKIMKSSLLSVIRNQNWEDEDIQEIPPPNAPDVSQPAQTKAKPIRNESNVEKMEIVPDSDIEEVPADGPDKDFRMEEDPPILKPSLVAATMVV